MRLLWLTLISESENIEIFVNILVSNIRIFVLYNCSYIKHTTPQ